ncbi:UDP-glycosyltransferase 89B2-like [Apium graveolens]|uniref:UDP-glycosyltransferase 89B2-like n=1 Tax=Apium graveolens TaxID=4045 RepID=UPI003D79D5D6
MNRPLVSYPPMAISEPGAHILIIPYPAQGHMIPLLDLTHQLALRNLIITIVVTPNNLHYLNPLLIRHPSIQPLVLPFPAAAAAAALPAGIENIRDLPFGSSRLFTMVLADLYDPIVNWFQNHPSPPVAVVSDIFLGWTNMLANELKISRYVFSPSGALALSIVYNLWQYMPKRNDVTDKNEVIKFLEVPNSPSFPWWKISPVFRNYVAGDPQYEVFKDSFQGNISSWGLVINSLSELELVYLDYLKEFLGHDRVWEVGPLLPPKEEQVKRGGLSENLAAEMESWLDQFEDSSVVYVCFGSQAVLRNKQMEMVALGLEKSGIRFLWSYKDPTEEELLENYGTMPLWLKDRVEQRGYIVKGWVPQVSILSHRGIGAFFTHCGWNSVLESITAGVPMLTWPMGADQFANADLMDELKVGTRVCEGDKMVPESVGVEQGITK